jgi:polyphenol oxidase
MQSDLLVPSWGAGPRIGALMSTRQGGVSAPPWHSLNLGLACDDSPSSVHANRARLADAAGVPLLYLNQVHGNQVLRVDAAALIAPPPMADAAWTDEPGIACVVLVADCLPVLLAAPRQRAVAAAHAGWRGLAAGVLDNTVRTLCAAAHCEPAELEAWLGPCIGPRQFEVGADVLQAFGVPAEPTHSPRFRFQARADGQPRWRADLAGLAQDRLRRLGLARLSGGAWCTVEDASRFFSFRRDGSTGRMAAAVWIRGQR